MKIQSLVCTLMLALLVFAGDALAKGPGNGGGGGSGDDVGVPPDYGDLVKLYRDEYGVPILTYYNSTTFEGQCQQPLGFVSENCIEDLLSDAYVTCGGYDSESDTCEFYILPVDEETCTILPGYEGCTQEVDFGRINEARAPEGVLESQLEDVLVNLATADCVTLGPAGRMVASRVDDLDEVTSSAIDSPLQNLAIYKQMILTGSLGVDLNWEGGNGPNRSNPLFTAARALGAASGKTGEVDVDLVVYLNQIMGLSDEEKTFLGEPILQQNREEVLGEVIQVWKSFLNYESFEDNRTDNFSTIQESLPFPRYIPEDPSYGWFEHLALLDGSISGDETFQISRGSILEHVFGSEVGFEDGNIGGFAQAADDARAVINFMHSWPLPTDYATKLTCDARDDIGYDLSISPESGLQVPVQMVATTDETEGREFIVTVANAGPNPAKGDVLVTVETAEGSATGVVEIVGADGPYWNGIVNKFEFPFEDLAAGTSESWTVMFTMSEINATRLTWTATIVAEEDVFLSNNTVNATTNVKLTGGGGGGRQ